MVLEIIPSKNGFKIKGELSENTLAHFRRTIRKAFFTSDPLVLDINSLTSIDRKGVNALAKLHNDALLDGRSLLVVGVEKIQNLAEMKSTENS